MRAPRTLSLINLPLVTVGVRSFSFDCSVAEGNLTFVFRWLNSTWNCWVTLPGGEVRAAGCVPGVWNWTKFPDFGLLFVNAKAALGLGDLVGSSMFLAVWP